MITCKGPRMKRKQNTKQKAERAGSKTKTHQQKPKPKKENKEWTCNHKNKSKCKTNRKLRKQAQRRERVNGVRMGKEEMEKTRTGHVEGGASIMGRGKGKKQKREGHLDWSEQRRIGEWTE